MGDHKNLEVWQLAHELTLDVYRATLSFPKEETYCLSVQLRRAVASIESNISEGYGFGTDPQICRHLRIARGSVNEVECQLLIARDLGYLKPEVWCKVDGQAQRVGRMLSGLIGRLGGGSHRPATRDPRPATS